MTPTRAPGGAPPARASQAAATGAAAPGPPAAAPGGAAPGRQPRSSHQGAGAPPDRQPTGGRRRAPRTTPAERGRHAAATRAARSGRHGWPARFAGAGYPVAPTHQPPGAILGAGVPTIIPQNQCWLCQIINIGAVDMKAAALSWHLNGIRAAITVWYFRSGHLSHLRTIKNKILRSTQNIIMIFVYYIEFQAFSSVFQVYFK